MSLSRLSAAFLVPVLSLVYASSACSSDDNGSSSSSGGASSGGTSSGGASSGGASSSSGTPGTGGGGAFWFISRSVKKVGATDLAGTEGFEDQLDANPLDIAIGGGAAWVVTDDGKLLRYDLAKPARVALDVAKHPSHVVFAAGAIWVTDDDDGTACVDANNGMAKVVRIDPANNSVVTKLSVSATTDTFPCNRFDGLATDGKSVFALVDNAFGVARIDPASNQVVNRAPLGEGAGYGNGNIATTSSVVWVANTDGHFLIALDPTNLAQKSKTPAPTVPSTYLASLLVATEDAVYIGGKDKAVLRVDAKNPTTQDAKTFSEEPDWLAFRDGKVYGSASPQIDSFMIAADATSLTELNRVSLPYLYGLSKFVFVP